MSVEYFIASAVSQEKFVQKLEGLNDSGFTLIDFSVDDGTYIGLLTREKHEQ